MTREMYYLVGIIVGVFPLIAYYTMKLGTYGYLAAKYSFDRRYHPNKEKLENGYQKPEVKAREEVH